MFFRILFSLLLAALPYVALPGSALAADPISPEQALQFINETPHTLIIDVRSPQEFADKHHPKAINVPVEKLEDILAANPDLIAADKPVMLYCRSGVRAARAFATISARYPNADIRYIDGTVEEFLGKK